MLFVLLWTALYYRSKELEKTGDSQADNISQVMPTLYIWYTDEGLTDYINSAALSYLDTTGVRVVPVLKNGLEYLEGIGAASRDTIDLDNEREKMPDLYIIGADSLEKAAMAGVAMPITDPGNIMTQTNFLQTSLAAATYHGVYYGYPFYYETAFMVYNKTYLRELADQALRREFAPAKEPEEGEEGSGTVSDNEAVDPDEIPGGFTQAQWDVMVDLQAESMIPHSIEDIEEIAGNYDAPEGVENIFLWDVSDLFYNYFFVGAYMQLGGNCGDDETVLEIYNEDTVHCMEVYGGLHQFFSIESAESSYDKVLEDFLAGNSIFTIVTTDALPRLQHMSAEGTFPYEYSVASLPAVDNEHEAEGLSTTNCVVINGFTNYSQEANMFAHYLIYNGADTLYERTGKMPAINVLEDSTDAREMVRAVYAQTESLPKLIKLSNFWINLEGAFTQVWNGGNPNEILHRLSEQMKTQIEGSIVSEPMLEFEEEDTPLYPEEYIEEE